MLKIKKFIKKVLYTLAFIALCFIYIQEKVTYQYRLLREASLFNPIEHVQEIRASGKLKQAQEFADFYLNSYSPFMILSEETELATLSEEIAKERSSWSYRMSQMKKALLGEECDELYAQGTSTALEITAVGDIRDISRELKHVVFGDEVDKFILGLSSLSLALDAATFTGALSAPAAGANLLITTLKRTAKTMSAALRSSILNKLNSNLSSKSSQGIAEFCTNTKNDFSDVIDLLKRNTGAAIIVINQSDNIKDLNRKSQVATQLGSESSTLLKLGGKVVSDAAIHANPEGLAKRIKEGLYYGPRFTAQYLISNYSEEIESLSDDIRWVKFTLSGRLLAALATFLGYIPFGIGIILMITGAYILCIRWGIRGRS